MDVIRHRVWAALMIGGLLFTSVPGMANPALVPGQVTLLKALGSGTSQGISVCRSNPNTIYWGSDFGLMKSTDAGASWNKVGNFGLVVRVKADPDNENHVYVAVGVRGANLGFYITTDGGATWTYPAGFAALAAQLQTLGYANFWDGYSVTPDPTDFNHILYATHGAAPAVGESFDGGNTWRYSLVPGAENAGGYNVFFLYNPATGTGNSSTWLFGTQGKGYWRTSNSGANWTQVITENMTHGGGAIYYTASGVLHVTVDAWPGTPMRSSDNGQTWIASSTSGIGAIGVMGDGNNIFTGVGMGGNGPLYYTPENSGAVWQPYPGCPSIDYIFEFDYDAVNKILYFSSGGFDASFWALKIGSESSVVVDMSRNNTRMVAPISRTILETSGITTPLLIQTGKAYDINGRLLTRRLLVQHTLSAGAR